MPQIQFIITMDTDSGSIGVSGPIDNKVLSYGMLAVAADAVRNHGEQKEERKIVPAHLVMPPNFNKQ